MNAYGYARATVDVDIAAEEAFRPGLLAALLTEGFEGVHDVEALTNLLHPDRALGPLDVMWLDGMTSERVFRDGADLQHLPAVDPLALDALPSATGAVAEALERERPGGLPYADYFRFLSQFQVTAEALRAIPVTDGPRFTLD